MLFTAFEKLLIALLRLPCLDEIVLIEEQRQRTIEAALIHGREGEARVKAILRKDRLDNPSKRKHVGLGDWNDRRKPHETAAVPRGIHWLTRWRRVLVAPVRQR